MTDIEKNLKADVVVVGGGGAGLAAAVSAAENGAKVVLLEKRRKVGGNSAMAEGLFAVESPVQKRECIDARKEEFFKMAMDYAHWKIDGRLIRAFVNKSGDTIRWLEEKGVKLYIVPYSSTVPYRVWHCPEKGGPEIIKALDKSCSDLGVEVISDATVKKLITDGSGSVTGVLATKGQSSIRVDAQSTIIASGGFGGNKELLNKHCSFYREEFISRGLPFSGDGIIMATDVGAATEGMGHLHLHGPFFPGSKIMVSVIHEPEIVWVNKLGKRFTDEATGYNGFESINSILRQPDTASYTLLDDRIMQDIIENGFVRVFLGTLYGRKAGPVPELKQEMEKQADKGLVKVSDSWEQIAAWIGAKPDVLLSTISQYNSFCDQKCDPVFGKEMRYLQPLLKPPFYAIKGFVSYLTTMGGIKINEQMEALDGAENPIPGLFAAGIDTGGWESETYCVLLSGSTFGFAINSGRIAGENAARYSLDE